VRRLIPRVLRENLVFRRVWSAQTISLFGDQISMIAIPLTAVLVLDASAKQMGFLVAAELVPNLLFALHAGAWADRHGNRRRVMIFTDLARAALLATIPVAYAFEARTIVQLYVVAFLVGTMTVFFFVAYSSRSSSGTTTSKGTRCSQGAVPSRSSPARASAASSCSC
jgi:MFS family permease